MKEVTIYTDGACSGNPGPGGWAAILIYGKHEKELSGGEEETTNNRMELSGVIAALGALTERCSVTLYTDSQYIERAVNEHWLDGWKKRGWRRREGPVKNLELWQELDRLLGEHSVAVRWVKGHAENEYNNRCDALAVRRRDEYAALREGKR
ncbi:MAG TPA: ribonuclease HI [Candidatus Scatomorpha stercorigallinarum]|nr:ribonuclease HI [Candidatus Scatomorpha stercorigallinarum]